MLRSLTAETTDEQILSPILAAKQELLEFVTEEMDSEYLKGDRMVALAQNIYSAEAVATVALRYAEMLREGASQTKRIFFLATYLTRGADDTWSGRTGDQKRLCHDAVRSFIERQMDQMRYAADKAEATGS